MSAFRITEHTPAGKYAGTACPQAVYGFALEPCWTSRWWGRSDCARRSARRLSASSTSKACSSASKRAAHASCVPRRRTNPVGAAATHGLLALRAGGLSGRCRGV
eukprot:357504-Chlamydomonas_euryale.AAC.3